MRAVLGVGLGVLVASIALHTACVFADEIPLLLNADELYISSDQSVVEAEGAVTAQFEEVSLSADALSLRRDADGEWWFEAIGDVRLSIAEDLVLSGDRIAAAIEADGGTARPISLEAAGFRGESRFTNASGESHTLYFRGESGEITFDEAGEPSLIEVHDAEATIG